MSRTVLELALKALRNSVPKPLPTDDVYADGAWLQHFSAIKAVREAIVQSPDAVFEELEKRAEFNRNSRKSIDSVL